MSELRKHDGCSRDHCLVGDPSPCAIYTTHAAMPGRHRSYHDKFADNTAREIDDILERLDELEDWAIEQGYRALEHKISEARGPLSSAAEAMRQYATGELRPRE